jgi:hypothetical protein
MCHVRSGVIWLGVSLFLSAAPARAAEVDKLLPNDTQYVMTLNVRQLLDAPLTKKYGLAKIESLLKEDDEVQDVLKSLGLDPLKDISQVAVASKYMEDLGKAFFIIHGKFDVPKFQAKANEVAENLGDILKIHAAGDFKIYEVSFPGQRRTIFVSVLNPSTIVASPNKDYVTEALEKESGQKKGEVSKDLQNLLDKVDDKKSLWVAALRGSLDKTALTEDEIFKPMLDKIKTVAVEVTVSDHVEAELDVVAPNSDSATKLNKEIAEGLKEAKGIVSLLAANETRLQVLFELLEGAKVTTKESSVLIKSQVSAEVIDKSLKGKQQ